MGAQGFDCTAKGEDAEEAFYAAVEDARYEYGHGGYTGTIAEKDSFVMVSDATMSPAAASELAARLINTGDDRINDKWGPAGCIALDNGDFQFFGWASS